MDRRRVIRSLGSTLMLPSHAGTRAHSYQRETGVMYRSQDQSTEEVVVIRVRPARFACVRAALNRVEPGCVIVDLVPKHGWVSILGFSPLARAHVLWEAHQQEEPLSADAVRSVLRQQCPRELPIQWIVATDLSFQEGEEYGLKVLGHLGQEWNCPAVALQRSPDSDRSDEQKLETLLSESRSQR